MIDVSKAGLNLKGVLIRGRVELIEGEEARQTNRSIHLKYVTPEALSDPYVASYLSKGDDITVKIHIDSLISWYRTMSDWVNKVSQFWCAFHLMMTLLKSSPIAKEIVRKNLFQSLVFVSYREEVF